MTIKIIPNEKGNPPGKLADVELHFTGDHAIFQDIGAVSYSIEQTAARATQLACAQARLFAGLKLIGFAVWERRTRDGRFVTLPARTYSVNGTARSFALLRSVADDADLDPLREAILAAYAEYEKQAAAGTVDTDRPMRVTA
jgi:hypothetical protein